MSDTNKMRNKFEEAWRERYPDHGESAFIRSHLEPDSYAASRVKDAWWAWQASRQAVVVELPSPNNDYDNFSDRNVSGACKYLEIAKSAIEAVGLRCEEKS